MNVRIYILYVKICKIYRFLIFLQSRIRKNISELTIKEGESLRLTSDKDFVERCTEKMIYVDYEDLVFQMVPGSIVYLADGQIKLRVDTIGEKTKSLRLEI